MVLILTAIIINKVQTKIYTSLKDICLFKVFLENGDILRWIYKMMF